jgi:PHP domain
VGYPRGRSRQSSLDGCRLGRTDTSRARGIGWKRALLLGGGLLLGLFLLRVGSWQPLAPGGREPDDGRFRVAGIVHVHTTLSDGGGSPEEVIEAARTAGLGFVAITDHNNLDAKPLEGYHGGVLVLVGSELSTNAGHVLALGIPDPAFRFSGDARDVLDDVRDLGGISFAAHPSSQRADLRWTGWDLPGPWGVELLNGDSEWRRAGGRLALTAALYGINRSYALLRSLSAPDAMLARWDAMLATRDVPGIVGADAHSRVPLTRGYAVRFPSYEALFSLARNHVVLDRPLSGDATADAARIVEALRDGRSYVGIDALADAGGVSFTAEGGGRRFTMGDQVPWSEGLRLRVTGRIPPGAQVSLLRDGESIARREDEATAEVSAPGVYRAEIRIGGWPTPWVLTNPIYVFDDEARRLRRRNAAWPEEPAPPEPARVLDEFEGSTSFETGSDAASTVNRDPLDPRGGVGGGGAALLDFHLAAPGPGRPHTYCALVDWTHRDLSGTTGLVFSIRSDGWYRIWAQVRDENPASRDEGTEWWFASIRTTPEWRRVALPYSRLRSINPATDGRLDLDQVRALVFVLDRGAVKVGTRGTIWIDDLGAY